mmetsp:Transcript_26596/g.41278  ORF Transcript_26596/g.41278 Transcript_26596/m.41278 type:complete len:84 (-) Transcript_26596:35-286(-)
MLACVSFNHKTATIRRPIHKLTNINPKQRQQQQQPNQEKKKKDRKDPTEKSTKNKKCRPMIQFKAAIRKQKRKHEKIRTWPPS